MPSSIQLLERDLNAVAKQLCHVDCNDPKFPALRARHVVLANRLRFLKSLNSTRR